MMMMMTTTMLMMMMMMNMITMTMMMKIKMNQFTPGLPLDYSWFAGGWGGQGRCRVQGRGKGCAWLGLAVWVLRQYYASTTPVLRQYYAKS